jgi:hypothetical protein
LKKERLRELVKDERLIRGIYNYCDRWCERCPQTSRCLNFIQSEQEFSDPESRDIRNEAFWKRMSEIFVETLEFLKEAASEWGIDLDAVDSETAVEEARRKDELADGHELCLAAKAYSERVQKWFSNGGGPLLTNPAAVGEEMNLQEALEVVQWYQHFIYVKLMRAVSGRMDESEDDGFARDSDGSAKVALIAMDRSIGAWGVIRQHALSDQEIKNLIGSLGQLREAVEKEFPEARSFIRPGFDKIDLNS